MTGEMVTTEQKAATQRAWVRREKKVQQLLQRLQVRNKQGVPEVLKGQCD